MLENNIYNIDIQFDYSRIKDIILKSLEKIVKEEALKNIRNDSKNNRHHPVNVNRLPAPPTSPLKPKN
jgi:hypothetical protein